jgi:glyoxylase-like metal-dependent hydrolase (beta-lactamase superfamily II)
MERRVWSLEGNRQRLDGGAMFGNAPRSLWERWATPDERNRIELACRCLLVQEGSKWILFEAGIGAFFDTMYRDRYGIIDAHHVLLESLAAVGLTDADISTVVLSHLHFDHAGGILSAWEEGKMPHLIFPNATFVVSRDAWDRARHPHPRDRASFIPHLNRALEECGRLEVVDGDQSVALGPDYRFHLSDGHTPGLMLTEIPGKDGPIVFGSDLIPGRAWVHTSISMGYDRFPELLLDEKKALLDYLIPRHGRLFLTHDSEWAMARATRDERGRYGSVSGQPQLAGLVA